MDDSTTSSAESPSRIKSLEILPLLWTKEYKGIGKSWKSKKKKR